MSDRTGNPNAFLERAEDHFREAVAAELPIFLTQVAESTPLNATPLFRAV